MKTRLSRFIRFASIAAAATLVGCAAPGPANYGSRAYNGPVDPNGWQTVSVTPVPLGTGERAGDAGVVTSTNIVANAAPVSAGSSVYPAGPVVGMPYYYGAPVYAPAPVYVRDPFWYPPVSIGLGLSFGRSWGGGGHHHGGYRRR
jgi:hypothetical protein